MKEIIELFNVALIAIVPDNRYSVVADLGLKLGYLVHPDCNMSQVVAFLKNQPVDYSSTFYKCWDNITNKSRFELYLDQIRHYTSTYGTDHQGEPWFPVNDQEKIPYTKFKVILPATADEILNRCNKMLSSGIALHSNTLDKLFKIFNYFNYVPDIETIKNKEAKMYVYKLTDTVPQEPTEWMRYVIYLLTGKCLLIKDKMTIASLKLVTHHPAIDVPKLIAAIGEKKLATIFFRFKPLFLALKKADSKGINRLRKLANKYHQPMTPGFFETLLQDRSKLFGLTDRLRTVTNFKKISLLQTIKLYMLELDLRLFSIRNGKVWVKSERVKYDKEHLNNVYTIVYKSLIDSLALKATTVKLPNDAIELTLPVSEKAFLGNLPFGSRILLNGEDGIIGIHWTDAQPVYDYDLSLQDVDGRKYGWDAAYTNKNNSIIFSGDVTSCNPEATELHYAKGNSNFQPCMVQVNRYSSGTESKFNFFIAREKISNLSRNYMVDPNNIVFKTEILAKAASVSIGIITDKYYIASMFEKSNRRSAHGEVSTIDLEIRKLETYLDLKTVLIHAGFTIVNENADIDLSTLSKDSLISLLA